MAIVITTYNKLPEYCGDYEHTNDCPCYNSDSGCCQAVPHWGLIQKPALGRPDWCPLISVDLGGPK